MKNILQKIVYRVAIVFLILGLTGGFSSCKSHKKNQVEDTVHVGETVSVKKKKKKKADKIKSTRNQIVDECLTWIGTPYGYGHSEKRRATDCSGMVIVVYEKIANLKLPRNSAKQAEYCDKIKDREILPGDLVFFATGKDKKKVSHVGVMVDKNKFVHASGSKGVILSEMTTPYYQRTFLMYGRVPGLK